MIIISIYFQFPWGWWPILAIIYLIWLTLFLSRKSYQNSKELKAQVIFAIVNLVICLLIEVIAISLEVWTYFPGNWPIVLWLGYFGGGLAAYQMIKKVEEIVGK